MLQKSSTKLSSVNHGNASEVIPRAGARLQSAVLNVQSTTLPDPTSFLKRVMEREILNAATATKEDILVQNINQHNVQNVILDAAKVVDSWTQKFEPETSQSHGEPLPLRYGNSSQ